MSENETHRSSGLAWLTALFVAAAVLFAFSASPESASAGSISGYYSVEPNVAPVFCYGSASVYDSDGEEVAKKNFGAGVGVHDYYQFNGLATDDYRVGFQMGCMGELDFSLTYNHAGFYRSKGALEEATPIHVTDGSARTGINSIPGGGASISGTVTDSSGDPLGGICIDSYDDQGNLGDFGRTGPDGTYLIDQFTAGSYRLKFSDCLNPESTIVPEFYGDKATLGEASPVSLEWNQDVSGVDAELAAEDSPVYRASIGKVTAKGPFRVRKGWKGTFRVAVTNAGNAGAKGVKVKVTGRGVSAGRTIGSIAAGATKSTKLILKPGKPGKASLTFRVTSSNAGGKTFYRNITVRK